jgi:hypothetical protein
VSATDATSGGTVLLGWTNPADVDFAFVRVYRSTQAGVVGSRVADAVSGTSYVDTGLIDGTTYHYTLRAVDAAGNESVDSAQVAATPTLLVNPNKAVRLDHVDDIISVPYAAALNAPGAMTIESWVYVDSFQTQPIIASRWEGSQLSWTLYYSNDGRVRFYVRTPNNAGYVQATSGMNTLRTGTWQHVAGVLDPATSQIRLYVGGTLVASAPYTSGAANTTTARLFVNGAWGTSAPTGMGDARFDEVRFSSVARYTGSSYTPALTHTSDASTLGLWHLDDGAGTTAIDAGPGARNGVIGGDPEWLER